MENFKDKFLLLFEDCRIVKGAKNIIIMDLNRVGNSHYIPIDMVTFIRECEDTVLTDVLKKYNNSDKEILLEYVSFLIEKEYCHLADIHLANILTPLDLTLHDSPSVVNNAILCVSRITYPFVPNIIVELNSILLCEHLEVRWFDVDTSKLANFLKLFDGTLIKSITLFIEYDKTVFDLLKEKLLDLYPRLFNVFLFNSEVLYSDDCIKCLSNSIDLIKGCGIISQERMVINQEFYTESLNKNTCLYKKVAIDSLGNIKNCPAQKKSHGNVNQISIYDAISKDSFSNLWNITKDKINVCRSCEYRHMCLDCRIYIEDPEDIHSKPLKCGYNPYTGEWSEWSINPLKQKAIEYYGMQDLVKKE